MNNKTLEALAPYGLLALLFAAALAFRPLLPIDETRYLTVAWEMFLQKQYAVLSLNFEPYHHKPPLLFWLINGVWEVLGVSRWSALIPIFTASALAMFLTQKLATTLKLDNGVIKQVPWIMIGSLPFLIYNTLIMFDVMIMTILLAVLTTMLSHSQNPRFYKPLLAGLLIGLGVLAKGPVMYLYVLWPLVLYPFWKPQDAVNKGRFYAATAIAVLVSALPVLAWLIPALTQTGNDFAFWLVWNQTAGRVTGNFSASHARPVYFYLLLAPILFMPWICHPRVWKNWSALKNHAAFKFLIAAALPTFISFSLISGKQPHYLLPLLPFIIISISILLEAPPVKKISLAMCTLIIIGQLIAHHTFIERYDLTPVAEEYKKQRDKDWAFAPKYQGEIGFLAKVEKPITSLQYDQLEDWLKNHPDGLAMMRHKTHHILENYKEEFSQPYKGRSMGIFSYKPANP